MSQYRNLTTTEIIQLEKNHCRAENWQQVKVKPDFDPGRLSNVEFSGEIKLGIFEKTHFLWGDVRKHCGIYNAKLHNCIVHDNVLINKISNYIANYEIEENAIINNVGILAVNTVSSFGNGTMVQVLNEAGGREVMIYEEMTAQIAYLQCFYRHETEMVRVLQKLISQYSADQSSSMGIVGKEARILNTRSIRNAKIGDYSVIEDADVIENGTLVSNEQAPVRIGPGVYAKDFICQSGSILSDGAVITHCFIGQGCELSKQFSAENSLFFANCGCFHGEACAIFAGPFTVTHHKSTLLIAGYFSFFNAGSGSNQSNHMYKLGPCHQGILERGAKTASDSYLLYPFKIGAFSLVMGRHYKHSDISGLPYSYLIESNDESILIPGVNLRSVGTIRDAVKWPNRDKRTDSVKLDIVNFDLLSPYTVNKMAAGIKILKQLQQHSGTLSDFYTYNNVKIKNSSLRRGIRFYETGIIKFMGNTLVRKLKNQRFSTSAELTELLKQKSEYGSGQWLDVAGMFMPAEAMDELIRNIRTCQLPDLQSLRQFFQMVSDQYETYKWTWFVKNFEELTGTSMTAVHPDDLVRFLHQWQEAVVNLDNQYLEDCEKEFSLEIMTGYGIDGNETVAKQDFAAVRGLFDTNSFVTTIQQHKKEKFEDGQKVIEKLLLL
ncbi:MAG: DUF4954 family protein [Candidatus Marinimicrobia bacterium]|nr:DUF4954 family protein [Candidatus Neomarinimicrobiota bacterium]